MVDLEKYVFNIFKKYDAVWVHDGNSKSPHAELTSGMCSNGFFDCLKVLRYPYESGSLALKLVQKLMKAGVKKVDWVIGSPYAAITFSYEVARILNATHGFTEKDPLNPKGKRMLWRRMTIPKNSIVLQIEELITTSGTLKNVRQAIQEGNSEPVNFLPIVGTIIHRPPELPANYGDFKVVSLVEKEIWAVEPKNCPLCKAGSPRYRPKSNWNKLTKEE